MAKKLLLFIWRDVFTDYTPGIAFAIAHDKQEAINAIIEDANGRLEGWIRDELNKEPETYSVGKVYGTHVEGGG